MGRACCAGRDERRLDRPQVGQERLGRVVRQGCVTAAGRVDAGRREQQRATVGLVRCADADALGDVRIEGFLGGHERGQSGVGGRLAGVERQGAADAGGGTGEPEQDVLGGDLGGLARDVRGDERVAVPVAADPRAEAHEGRSPDRAAARVVPEQPVVEQAVDLRDDLEQRLVEHAHRRPDLVERGRPGGAERRGAQEVRDLLEQPPFVLGARGGVLRAVPLVDEVGDAADGRGDRAATGLGRVGGQHGVEAEGLEPCGGLVRTHLVHEFGVGGGERVARDTAVVATLTEDAHTVVLLGQVRQVEVRREGAGDLFCPLRRQRRDDGLGPRSTVGVVALVRRDDRRTERLDVLEQVVAAALAEHPPEQAAEVADVRAQVAVDRTADVVTCAAEACRAVDRRHLVLPVARDVSAGTSAAYRPTRPRDDDRPAGRLTLGVDPQAVAAAVRRASSSASSPSSSVDASSTSAITRSRSAASHGAASSWAR